MALIKASRKHCVSDRCPVAQLDGTPLSEGGGPALAGAYRAGVISRYPCSTYDLNGTVIGFGGRVAAQLMNMGNRLPGPAEKTIRRLFAMSGNICAFPDCSSLLVKTSGTITGEICHIRAKNPGGARFDNSRPEKARHAYEDLILLCRQHHKVVDAEERTYTVDILEEMKKIHEQQLGRVERESDGIFAKLLLNAMRHVEVNNIGNVVVASPGAIVGGIINVRSLRRTLKFQPAEGTIGADQDASRYVQYLIKRYNEFAAADSSRATKFNYGVIRRNIEDRFRAPWQALSMERFPDLCRYLWERISRTHVAKSNTAKGHGSFSTFDDYVREAARTR